MSYKVLEADRKSYEDEGVVCLRGVIDPSVCEYMLGAVHEFMINGESSSKADIRTGGGRYFSANTMSKTTPAFRDFALSSPLGSVAGQLMHGDIPDVGFFVRIVTLFANPLCAITIDPQKSTGKNCTREGRTFSKSVRDHALRRLVRRKLARLLFDSEL